MRRLHGGLLAAALLLSAGCGSEDRPGDAGPGPETTEIRTPTLAVTTQALTAARPSETTSTVLVTSPDGLSSPGLDAVATALIERPEITVVVVAPGAADGDGETMSGYPAHVVAVPPGHVVAAARDRLGIEPDLVVVGLVEGAVLGTGIDGHEAVHVARSAVGAGIPALAIAAGTDNGTDHAAATSMLRALVDLELESLLVPGARLLTVPSCDGGIVRGPIEVEPARQAASVEEVDCGGAGPPDPLDDVEAHAGGYGTLVHLAG